MNDPLGVQSAVLGMLSLSQQPVASALNVQPSEQFSSGPPNNQPEQLQQYPAARTAAGSSSSYAPSEVQKGRNLLPLTPPGSPDDDPKQMLLKGMDAQGASRQFQREKPGPATGSDKIYSSHQGHYNHHNFLLPSDLNDQSTAVCQFSNSYQPQLYFNQAAEGDGAGIKSAPMVPKLEDSSSVSTTSSAPLLTQLIGGLQEEIRHSEGEVSASSRNPPVAFPPYLRNSRSRNEKKPIPDGLKDNKYFERRKRNNQAAKKSRDSRKQREEEVNTKKQMLERENAILHAQLDALREEARQLSALLQQNQRMEQQAAFKLQQGSVPAPQALHSHSATGLQQ